MCKLNPISWLSGGGCSECSRGKTPDSLEGSNLEVVRFDLVLQAKGILGASSHQILHGSHSKWRVKVGDVQV